MILATTHNPKSEFYFTVFPELTAVWYDEESDRLVVALTEPYLQRMPKNIFLEYLLVNVLTLRQRGYDYKKLMLTGISMWKHYEIEEHLLPSLMANYEGKADNRHDSLLLSLAATMS